MSDTIVAIATPLGIGGIGIIRISGPKSLQILYRVFCPSGMKPRQIHFASRHLYYGQFFDSNSKKAVDYGTAVFIRGPKSYTGEDIVELGTHGSMYIQKALLDVVVRHGARLAGRGEFTRRAFLNGKIDLAQAEAVLDLVNARSSRLAGNAVKVFGNRLSIEIQAMRRQFVDILSGIEAAIDYPESIPSPHSKQLVGRLKAGQAQMKRLLQTAGAGQIIREGARIVIVGRTNVGKSSLLNAFLRNERALVTDEPGTTRDTIDADLNIDGVMVRIVDTAGHRRARGNAEKQGILRAQRASADADLLLLVIDASRALAREDFDLIRRSSDRRMIVVLNKIDICGKRALHGLISRLRHEVPSRVVIACASASTGEGIEKLEDQLLSVLLGSRKQKQFLTSETDVALINNRHRQCLERANEAACLAIDATRKHEPIDLLSTYLRDVISALGEITGDEVTQEVLDNIFSSFCVGK